MKKYFTLIAAMLMTVGAYAVETPTKSVTAIYHDLVYSGTVYANYTDADWKMKSDSSTFVVDYYGTDSLVIRNWFNQDVDLCVKYDPSTGDVLGVNNPGGTASYWAYASSSYYAYVSTKTASGNMSYITKKNIFLEISFGTTWVYYNLALPTYSVDVNPTPNAYNEVMQAQTSHKDKLNMDDFTATLNSFGDTLYILSSWEGVKGYDLKFTLGNQDSITVLNDNATEVVTSKGSRYWRVPTGRADYDRACVYQNSNSYNEFTLNKKCAYITFGCSYVYPVGSNSGQVAYYAVRGFNPDKTINATLRECVWSNAASAYVDTLNFNRNKLESVTVYQFVDGDSAYYRIPDFLGPKTGDLSFGISNGKVVGASLTYYVSYSGGYYYYLFDQTQSAFDYAYLNGFYSSDADFANGGSLLFDIYYKPAAGEAVYTYYCLNLSPTTALQATERVQNAQATVKTRDYIIKNGVKYNYMGQKIK